MAGLLIQFAFLSPHAFRLATNERSFYWLIMHPAWRKVDGTLVLLVVQECMCLGYLRLSDTLEFFLNV